MKSKAGKIISSVLVCTSFAVVSAQAANTPEPANVWAGTLYAEGNLGCIMKSAADVRLPVILYEGNTYFPLRTAGELTGKNVGWDAATKTASLSGSVEKVYQTDAKESAIPEDGKLSVSQDTGIQISIDGTVSALKDANGNRVYPIIYADTTYVPLRSVSELTGLEVKWTKNSVNDEFIFIRTPLTEAQIKAANDYVWAQAEHLSTLHDLAKELRQKDTLTEDLRTSTVEKLGAEIDKMEAEKCPDTPLLKTTDAKLREIFTVLRATVDKMKTASLDSVPSIASNEFRFDNEGQVYMAIIQMKMSLDQKGIIEKGDLPPYDINN